MRAFAWSVLAVLFVPLAAACHENGCDQPPFYECGAYQRETRTFCYYLEGGRYIRALEEDVVNLTAPPWSATPLGDPGVGLAETYQAYLWLQPLKALVDNPFGAPLSAVVYDESNGVQGLQARPFRCGTWVWYAEYPPGCWLGPFNVLSMPPDQPIV